MIYVVGIGPGDRNCITYEARAALEESDVIVGYKVYTELVRLFLPDKEYIESGMTQETERCARCIELAKAGHKVSLVCSGDAGVYGMASVMLELAEKETYTDVRIIPGVTSALSGAAVLGAPIGHDFAVISLSDRLTPWELIEKRLSLVAQAELCIVLYNPRSRGREQHLKKACDILLSHISGDTVCGYVRNIARDGEAKRVVTLKELGACEDIDMFTTVFIGNSTTRHEGDRMITPRGYRDI